MGSMGSMGAGDMWSLSNIVPGFGEWQKKFPQGNVIRAPRVSSSLLGLQRHSAGLAGRQRKPQILCLASCIKTACSCSKRSIGTGNEILIRYLKKVGTNGGESRLSYYVEVEKKI